MMVGRIATVSGRALVRRKRWRDADRTYALSLVTGKRALASHSKSGGRWMLDEPPNKLRVRGGK